jgi:molybdopterin-guanine dinucleotide biosynthesis protein A
VTAVIIAGGLAERLGGLDKWDLEVGGKRILDRQLSVLGHVAEHILIVSNDHSRFRSSGLRVCTDLIPGAGPLGGIYTALVRSPTTRTLVVACDLPFLTTSFLRYLVARARGTAATVPWTTGGPEPLCAVYDQVCVEPIRARLARGERRVSDLAHTMRVSRIEPSEVATFNLDGTLFLNVNTPDDYERANTLVSR